MLLDSLGQGQLEITKGRVCLHIQMKVNFYPVSAQIRLGWGSPPPSVPLSALFISTASLLTLKETEEIV